MADWWSKYEQSDTKPLPLKEDSYSRPKPTDDDPWAKYELNGPEYKKETKIDKEKKYKEQLANAKTPWQKLDAGANLTINRAMQQLPDLGHKATTDYIGPSLMKGVPAVRHYVPQTPELSEFEDKHPWAAKGLNVTGAVGSTLPLAAGAAVRSGAGFLPQLAGQTAVSAPLNLADVVAQKGGETSKEDAAKALGMGAATSTIPALFSSILGQSARHTARVNTPEYRELVDRMKVGGNTFPSGAPKLPPSPVTPGTAIPSSAIPGSGHDLTTLLSGIAGAHQYGPLGLGVGLYAGHMAHPMINRMMNTSVGQGLERLAQHPSTQDIIRALSAHGSKELAPYLALP